MQYLFSYLEGDAKRLVSKFAISGANYQNAWGTLIAHFDKKRYTVFSLVHEFLAQSPVTQATPQSLGRLVTTSDEIIQQLDALGNDFTGRDPWLIHLILEKLDKETRASWSQEVVDTENPTFEDLLEFLKKRCEVLETCSAFSKKPVNEPKKEAAKPVAEKLKMLHTTVDKKCAKCSSEHNTYQCEDFKNMSVKDRRELVQKAKLLSVNSATTRCCVRWRRSLIKAKKQEEDQSPEVPAKEEGVVVALTAGMEQGDKKSISLLPTAVVKVQQADGGFSSARVLIDSGSQASLVTEACVRKLKLPRRNGKLVVNGLGQQEVGTTRGLVTIRLATRFNDVVVLTTEAYVHGKLTTTIPSQRFNPANLKLLDDLGDLADPEFNRPGAIDIILEVLGAGGDFQSITAYSF
nr:uncharacterized protein LOC115269388 [Aedes albopictus]